MDFKAHQLVFLGLLGILHICLAGASQPNIVFLLVDDLGWNDVSWHNPDVLSPNLQNLHDTGISLENHYVQPVCTPTRAALLTGYYPFKIGRQSGIIRPQQPTGLTLEKTLLPERLKELGYATHLIGKWHLGFCDWAYTPTQRGFDTFYGFLLGSGDHFAHTRSNGYDFRDQEEVDRSAKGTYSSKLFANRAVEILRNASATDDPVFLLMSFQNVHGPHQVPKKFYNMYPDTLSHAKRTLYGMVTAVDDAVGKIVQTLKEEGLYDDTIIVFTSDNGAPRANTGSNKPLRGHKGSIWEGGTKTAAFVHSPLLKTSRSHKGLFHVTDWYNTLLEAASTSLEMSEHKEQANSENDGFSQWKTLMDGAPSPRDLFVYNLLHDKDKGVLGGIRRGQFKYMVGTQGPKDEKITHRLYDIDIDPYEENNLVDLLPEVALYMQVEMELLAKEMVPADNPVDESNGDPSNWNGVWTPGWCSVPS